jgi:hypothetical protein
MTPRAPMTSAQFPARQEGGEREAGRAAMPVEAPAISQEAARAMLAALDQAEQLLDYGQTDAALRIIRAAIALAEGRAS